MNVFMVKVDGTWVDMMSKKIAENGISITENSIWSSNTKRTMEDASMTGDIVGIKTSVTIKFQDVTAAEKKKLFRAIRKKSNSFFQCRYIDDDIANMQEKTMYTGSTSRTLDLNDGVINYKDLSITLIEQ